MKSLISYVSFTVVLVCLGPALAYFTKIKNFSLQKSLKYFIFLSVLRLAAVFLYSFYLIKSNGNLLAFLIAFAITYSVLLLPEVVMIAKILEPKRERR